MYDEIYSLLPQELIAALEASEHETWVEAGSPQIQNLYRLRKVGKNPPTEDAEMYRAHVIAWLSRQDKLQEEAIEVFGILMKNFSPDINSNVMPGWVLEPWALKIRSMWGNNLDFAILEAREWMALNG